MRDNAETAHHEQYINMSVGFVPECWCTYTALPSLNNFTEQQQLLSSCRTVCQHVLGTQQLASNPLGMLMHIRICMSPAGTATTKRLLYLCFISTNLAVDRVQWQPLGDLFCCLGLQSCTLAAMSFWVAPCSAYGLDPQPGSRSMHWLALGLAP